VNFTIQAATVVDRDRTLKFYESLDPESIYRRFGARTMSASHYDAVTWINATDRFGFLVCDEQSQVVGHGLLHPDYTNRIRNSDCELAVVVHRDYRRQGVATLLVAAITNQARTGRSRRLLAYVEKDNEPAYNLFKKLSWNVVRYGPETVFGRTLRTK
jgi:GNAT superfamily N-acetyltransferase